MKKNILSPILIILAGMLWGCMGIPVRKLSSVGYSSMEIALWRIAIAAVIVGVFILIYDRSLFKFKLKDIWVFLGSGVVSLAFFSICYFQNILTTSMAIACTMLYTSPVFVLLFSAVLFKEKITTKKIIAIALTLVGCIFVTGAVSGELVLPVKGILLGVGSSLGYALYSIFGRYGLEKGYHSLTITFYTFLFSSLAMIIPVNAGGMIDTYVAYNGKIELTAVIFGSAVFCTVLPYLFYTLGLKQVENGKASIMVATEPVVAALVGVFILGDEVTVVSFTGVALVLASIVILSLKDKNKG